MGGWIKLHRKLLEWEWWDDINVTRLWIYILIRANHESKKWRGIVIPAGTFITSYAKMSEETKLTINEVRTAIKKLQSSKNITSKTTNKYQAVTVVNWELYQSEQEKFAGDDACRTQAINMLSTGNPQAKGSLSTDKPQAINIPFTTNKNEKNLKNKDTSCSCIAHYAKVINPMPSPTVAQTLQSYVNDGMSEECVNAILDYCNDENKRSFAYVKAVLTNSLSAGTRTAQDFQKSQLEHKTVKPQPHKKASATNKFVNFNQRSVDYNAIVEKQLKDRLGESE